MDFQFVPYTILFMRVKFTIIETHAHNLYLNIARILYLRRLYTIRKRNFITDFGVAED